jgi:hypothetical protein
MVTYKGNVTSKLFSKFMVGYDAPVANVEIDYNSMRIDISTAYDMTENDVTATMLHEMAHVKLYDLKIINSPHHGSPKFVAEINRLRSESGLNITYKESNYKSSPKLQSKTRVVVLIYELSGEMGASVYSVDFIKKDPYFFNTLYLGIISKSLKIKEAEYYLFTSILLDAHPVRRNYKGISWITIGDDQAKEIRERGKKFGFCTKTEAEIDPGVLGSNLEKKIETTKKREFIGIHNFMKSDDVTKASNAEKEREKLNSLLKVIYL